MNIKNDITKIKIEFKGLNNKKTAGIIIKKIYIVVLSDFNWSNPFIKAMEETNKSATKVIKFSYFKTENIFDGLLCIIPYESNVPINETTRIIVCRSK